MNPILLWFHKLGSPPYFHAFATRWIPWFYAATALFALPGLYFGLWSSPEDYLQGASVRIMYIHVPCAWMGLFIYGAMALNGLIAIVWRIKLSELLAMACAPIGAAFTLVTLVTGSLWGRPTWGTYWEWDARMVSELVMLFLYFGVIGLHQSIEDPRKAARAASMLALIGLVNLPVIHYSVEWWNTLHQGSSIKLFAGKNTIDWHMLLPLFLMTFATKFYFAGSLLARTRVALLTAEADKAWVRELVTGETPASPVSPRTDLIGQ